MSEAVSAAAEAVTAETVAPPADPPRKLSEDEEKREAFRRFFKGEDGKFTTPDKATEKPAEKLAEPEAEAKADDEPTAGEKPADPAKEPEKPKAEADKLELNLARAQRDVKRLTTENVDEKKARTEAEGKLSALQKELADIKAKAKSNPLKAAEELSELSLKDIMERASKGEFDVKDPYSDLPPDVREAIEFAKEQKAEKARAAEAAKEEQSRQSDIGVMRDFISERVDEFDFLDPDAAEWVADQARAEFKSKGVTPSVDDIADIAKRCNDQIRDMLETSLVKNEKLRKSALKVSSIRDALVSELGIDKQSPKPTSSKAPPARPIASAPAEVVSRSENKRKSASEEREEHLKLLRAHQTRESA